MNKSILDYTKNAKQNLSKVFNNKSNNLHVNNKNIISFTEEHLDIEENKNFNSFQSNSYNSEINDLFDNNLFDGNLDIQGTLTVKKIKVQDLSASNISGPVINEVANIVSEFILENSQNMNQFITNTFINNNDSGTNETNIITSTQSSGSGSISTDSIIMSKTNFNSIIALKNQANLSISEQGTGLFSENINGTIATDYIRNLLPSEKNNNDERFFLADLAGNARICVSAYPENQNGNIIIESVGTFDIKSESSSSNSISIDSIRGGILLKSNSSTPNSISILSNKGGVSITAGTNKPIKLQDNLNDNYIIIDNDIDNKQIKLYTEGTSKESIKLESIYGGFLIDVGSNSEIKVGDENGIDKYKLDIKTLGSNSLLNIDSGGELSISAADKIQIGPQGYKNAISIDANGFVIFAESPTMPGIIFRKIGADSKITHSASAELGKFIIEQNSNDNLNTSIVIRGDGTGDDAICIKTKTNNITNDDGTKTHNGGIIIDSAGELCINAGDTIKIGKIETQGVDDRSAISIDAKGFVTFAESPTMPGIIFTKVGADSKITHSASAELGKFIIEQNSNDNLNTSIVIRGDGTGDDAICIKTKTNNITNDDGTKTYNGGIIIDSAGELCINAGDTIKIGKIETQGVDDRSAISIDAKGFVTFAESPTMPGIIFTKVGADSKITHSASAELGKFIIEQNSNDNLNTSIVIRGDGTGDDAICIKTKTNNITNDDGTKTYNGGIIIDSAGELCINAGDTIKIGKIATEVVGQFENAISIDTFGVTTFLRAPIMPGLKFSNENNDPIILNEASEIGEKFTIKQDSNNKINTSLVIEGDGYPKGIIIRTLENEYDISRLSSICIDSYHNLDLNALGVINIGNDDVDKNINIGTSGSRTIYMGNSVSKSTSVNIDCIDMVIKGNLIVQGSTTTVKSENTLITDPIIALNNGVDNEQNINDSGLLINRGNSLNAYNVFIGWDESHKKFLLANTTSVQDDIEISIKNLESLQIREIHSRSEKFQITNTHNGIEAIILKTTAIKSGIQILSETGGITQNTSGEIKFIATNKIKLISNTDKLDLNGNQGVVIDGNSSKIEVKTTGILLIDVDQLNIDTSGNCLISSANATNIICGTNSLFKTTTGAITIDGGTGIILEGNSSNIEINTSGLLYINTNKVDIITNIFTVTSSVLKLEGNSGTDINMITTAPDDDDKKLKIEARNEAVNTDGVPNTANIEIVADGSISLTGFKDSNFTTSGVLKLEGNSGTDIKMITTAPDDDDKKLKIEARNEAVNTDGVPNTANIEIVADGSISLTGFKDSNFTTSGVLKVEGNSGTDIKMITTAPDDDDKKLKIEARNEAVNTDGVPNTANIEIVADGEIKLGTSSLKPKININGSQLTFNNTILNKYILTTILQDISSVGNTCFVVAPIKGKITKIYWIIDGSIDNTDKAIIYVNINGSLKDVSNYDSSAAGGNGDDGGDGGDGGDGDGGGGSETGSNTTVPVQENIVIPKNSTAGKNDSILPKSNNEINNEGEYIRFTTDGGSTNVDKKVNVVFTIEITYS